MRGSKLISILNSAFFFAALAVLLFATVLSPKQSFSEDENRYLAELPRLSASGWFSGNVSAGLSDYCREHFALRSRWISLRTELELLSGHNEVNGIYISNGSFFEAPEPYDYGRIDRSVAAINSFDEATGGKLSVLIAPTSAQIYADRLPSYSPDSEQRKMINYVYDSLNEGIGKINVYDPLFRAREDYIYYRTDHHWTTYGAYIAYTECMRRYGYDPVTVDRIDVEHASHSFLGTYYSAVLSDAAEPDTVDFYTSGGAGVTSVKITSADGSVTERDGVIFREYLEKKDKYLCFLGPNVPLEEIETESGGGSILIIKDSYANCFVPFLTKHFGRIAVVDLRYMARLSDYADPDEFDRILLLYNASTFAEDVNIAKLAAEK